MSLISIGMKVEYSSVKLGVQNCEKSLNAFTLSAQCCVNEEVYVDL
jgi:hypothetical protein